MKKDTKKISKIVSLAASEERRHGEQTGQSRRNLNEQSEQLGELNAFREVYERKNPVISGVCATHLQDYQNFLLRLDNAVRSQQQIVRDCEHNLEMHRRRWLDKRRKLESLERILDNCRSNDAACEARLEQKRLDDIGSRPAPIFAPDDE